MTDSYYILIDGVKTGPFTFEELIDRGLDTGTRVTPANGSNWENASDVPDFYEYFYAKGHIFPTDDNLATFWWRLVAYLLDMVAIYIILTFVMVIIVTFAPTDGLKEYLEGLDTKNSMTQLKLNLIGFALSVVYNTIFEATPMRGSIGKKLCKIVVVDADGMRLSIGKAFIRNVTKFISGAALCIGYLNILWDEHRQAWHDQIARTYVLKPE
ncbi:RDD family protein [Mucilaginibacter sp.]|uniref:RDD family protein n=1 Tax=Mucilaginibacter sp. TaxID=1882438 RepID=UPI0035BC9224